jgi:hypothetical protein
MKAIEFLEKLRRTPGMWASNKEAFCVSVLTALIMDDIAFKVAGLGNSSGNFLKRHIGYHGAAISGSNDPFSDEWAHAVVDDALRLIELVQS